MAKTLVLPPDELVPYITQIWPDPRPDVAEAGLGDVWPGFLHLGRAEPAMNDDGLCLLSQANGHSWGVEGHEQAPSA